MSYESNADMLSRVHSEDVEAAKRLSAAELQQLATRAVAQEKRQQVKASRAPEPAAPEPAAPEPVAAVPTAVEVLEQHEPFVNATDEAASVPSVEPAGEVEDEQPEDDSQEDSAEETESASSML